MTGPDESGLLGAVLVLLPEVVLVVGAVGCLVLGSWTPRRRLRRLSWTATAVVVVSATATLVQLLAADDVRGPAVMGTVEIDALSGGARLAVAGSLIVLLAMARREAPTDPRAAEVAVLLLLGGAGAQLLALATDLSVLLLAFLLASIPLYGLLALTPPSEGTGQSDRAGRTAEATVKTYLLGALAGVLMMLGVVITAGVAGGTTYGVVAGADDVPPAALALGLVLVLTGLLFKAGAPPLHPWLPDAVTGCSTTAGAFATTVPKLGAVVAVGRLGESFAGTGALPVPAIVGVVAVTAMAWGNLAALTQRDVRRLLAWSTIGQTGFLLAGAAALSTNAPGSAGTSVTAALAADALAVYLPAYAAANLTCFAGLLACPPRGSLEDWQGAGRTRPGVVAALGIGLLALVGTPPAGVLVGKSLVLAATWDPLPWVAVGLVVTSVVSLAYSLRWFGACLAPGPDGGSPSHASDETAGTPRMLLLTTAAAAVVVGLGAGPILALTG
ncbi:hypothetical protein KLP28_14105 [Nocardioidaceae bacterium]|nr:hypothetical protein KLP28_14105 [Nocardioidaceae bacterium]